MYRKLLAAMLVFLLIAGLSAAQEDDRADKRIPWGGGMVWNYREEGEPLKWVRVTWMEPEKTPDSYRLSWAIEGAGWRSIHKKNTKRRGNMIVPHPPPTNMFGDPMVTITGLEIPWGNRGLRIRVRARYNGERNGPWRVQHSSLGRID